MAAEKGVVLPCENIARFSKICPKTLHFFMYKPPKSHAQTSLFCSLEDQLNHRHSLYILANKINWNLFEAEFSKLFDEKMGAPCKPIRRMTGLIILKHIRNISDESVVEQFQENAYYQYFCGERFFSTKQPCDASELVHFRHMIGEAGMDLILKESIRVNDDHDNQGPKGCGTVFLDTSVQEKNISFPTDAKLANKIIDKVQKIVAEEGLAQRQSYKRTLKAVRRDQRFRNHPKNFKKARKADRRLRTIAGRLVREVERNLERRQKLDSYADTINLFKKVLGQERDDKDKVYSLHEPEVKCISKGKEHKKYEFGNKVSIARSYSGIIVGAVSFRDEYDGHTIDDTLDNVEKNLGFRPLQAPCDRGYRGQKMSGATQIVIPSAPKKDATYYQKKKAHALFCKRAGIEPVIGHLKSDHRMERNFYKGLFGDMLNVKLAAAGYNFKRSMRLFFALFERLYCLCVMRGESNLSSCRNTPALA
jgi:IS5 family transposase